jgi:outer membrane protein TolC
MSKPLLLVCAFSFSLLAEVRPMSLRQAVEMAMKQNPDVTLARLDEEKARQGVRVARDPFTPRLTVGSGLAYSNGFPMSIEGSAPSVIQARASEFIFNRPQSFAVAQAKEDARGAAIAVTGKRDEVAYRVTALFLDAERSARIGALARKDAESQAQVLTAVQAQVREGRALPLAEKTAAYQVAYARQAAANLDSDQQAAETALALALGFPAEDRVRPVEAERPAPTLPVSEDQAVETAIEASKDLRRIESQLASKHLEIRGQKAARWPRVDLVAQYGMLARFNNYEQFFQKFQRNNGEIGVSFQLPLLAGSGVGAQAAQAQADVSHLKVELSSVRNRVASDVQQSFRDLNKAAGAVELAQLDLEVAREQLSVNLAQMQEGRLTMREVEQARVVENQKWIAFYDARYAVEKARWNVLRLTGGLLPSIQSLP